MGADVINMSWGDNQYSKLLNDVIQYAYENGVVMVGSAGNSSSDLPHYPSSFSQVISVGSIQENEALSSFSNFGSTIDLVAPGSQIITLGLEGTYKKVSGTSVSAPFVSAVASVLVKLKDFSIEEVKQILKTTANDIGDTGWDQKYAAGKLNFSKATTLLSPSEIKINHPLQDFFTSKDSLTINLTCLSSYFLDFELFYGVGSNPQSWNSLVTGQENYQIYKENVFNLDITDFSDTTYTVRLLVNRIDGNTLEERVNFTIDRSPPEILASYYFPAMLNDSETIQASMITDDFTKVKFYYRRDGSSEDFQFIYLDGFSGDLGTISTNHFGILPVSEQVSGIDYEIYFEAINQAGLSTINNNSGLNYRVKNAIENRQVSSYPKEYSLPQGRVFKEPVKLGSIEDKFVLINENETSADISLYRLLNNNFEKVNELKNRIPVSVGDFNNDGKTDILNLFVKNGYIDSQTNSSETDFQNIFADTSQQFWPSYAGDIDNDTFTEIIVFSSDTTISIWEVNDNFELTKETELTNFVDDQNGENSIFRNNIVLIDNFDDDPESEIIAIDNFSRVIIYQIDGNNNYSNDKIIEHFYPLESNSTIAKGDFNGDGRIDISVLVEFEENVYQTPLIYSSVFTFRNNEVEYLFQNMFISTESNFVSSFEKQYMSIELTDINQDNDDELIIFTFPNAYIFEHSDPINLLFYQSDVNSQSIFTGDLDGNGILEISIPSGDKLYFQEFIEDGRISPPVITDYYSLDSNRNYIEWNESDYPVFISRFNIDSSISQPRFCSISSNSFIDSVEPNLYYEYSVEFHDPNDSSIISKRSNIITVLSHAPGFLLEIDVISNTQVEVYFSQPLNSKEVRVNNFTIDESIIPSSVASSSNNSFLITSNNQLELGAHSISFTNLRDIYNTPFRDTIATFEVKSENEITKQLFIANYEIIDNYNLIVRFNFQLDSITALNKNNYSLSPNNSLDDIIFADPNNNSILLNSQKPFGSVGREYILKIENIYSSVESGYIPINKNSGSEIVITANAVNLDKMYVYPNPANISTDETITFANLTRRADIYIYSIDGIFINKISENDGNGGVNWNLKDQNNKKVGSGIYFYKALSMDNFDKTLQEKMGKFAVIK